MQLTRRALARFASVLGLGTLLDWDSFTAAGTDADAATETTAHRNGDRSDTESAPEAAAETEAEEEETAPHGDEESGDDEWTVPDDGPIEAMATVAADDVDEAGLESPVLSIHNTTSERRSLSLRINHDDATVLERTGAIPGETVLEIGVNEPGTYETTVESGSLRSSTTVPVSEDCADSHTEIQVGETGLGTNTSISC